MIDRKVCKGCGTIYNGGLGNCPKCHSMFWMSEKKAEALQKIPEGWQPVELSCPVEGKTLYLCDPARNTECRKSDCRVNGGDCYATHNIEYATYQPVMCCRIRGLNVPEQKEERDSSGTRLVQRPEEEKPEMTIPEKLAAMAKIIPEKMNTITRIDFPKDGRVLVWHEGQILQIPKWKLEEV
jgi:hypothetical protein